MILGLSAALVGERVQLRQCVQLGPTMPPLSAQEQAFGNYAPCRWMWHLEDPRPLVQPVPYRGFQGLFSVPAELVREVL